MSPRKEPLSSPDTFRKRIVWLEAKIADRKLDIAQWEEQLAFERVELAEAEVDAKAQAKRIKPRVLD